MQRKTLKPKTETFLSWFNIPKTVSILGKKMFLVFPYSGVSKHLKGCVSGRRKN
jgi:hypothetical protein